MNTLPKMKSHLLLFTLIAVVASGCSKSAEKGLEDSTIGVVGGKSVNDSTEEEAALATASTVALMKIQSDGSIRTFCTGTLIAQDMVLTAAHCARGRTVESIRAVMGARVVKMPTDPGVMKLEAFRPNPLFNQSTPFTEDVAVIKLATPAAQEFKPVPILESARVLPIGEKLLIAGFGRMDNGAGAPMMPESLQYTYAPLAEFDNRLVVIDQRGGSGACAGDSGGPAYAKRGNQLFVIGATRGPHGFARLCNEFGDFTDVTQFRTFIEDSAKLLGTQSPQFKSL